MKLLFSIFAFTSTLAHASEFSAFVNNNKLYATVIGDRCNEYGGTLNVSPQCDKRSGNRRGVGVCEAELEVSMTEKNCGPGIRGRVVEIPLAQTQVHPMATRLMLEYSGDVLEIPIEKSTISGFVKDNVLFLTVLGNNCDSLSGGIQVDASCNADRLTKNFALTCQADVIVKRETHNQCLAAIPKGHTFQIDLAKSKVAKEARNLILNYGDEIIHVQINK
jgi:hypothetical protein